MKLATAAVAGGFALLLGGTASAATFAAISYNTETGYSGYSHGYQSRDAAEERAAQECGEGCETVMWARDSCVALATSKSRAYGTGRDTDQESANQMAMNICSGYAGDCSIVAEACSDE
jgi:hypothetical protein